MTTGTEAKLAPSAVQELRGAMRGELIEPDSPQYDELRAVYNAMIDRRPAAIARCVSPADVIVCVNFGRKHELLTAVRCGGHAVAGTSVCDGGLLIDLGPMKGIRVDPVGRTVRAQGGCTWGDLDHATGTFGLATTGGVVSTTGIAGLTLGGGVGWLMRRYGLSCDNVVSVDVVTADGRLVTASEDENEDLFFGVRGGGGNFGIVTEFQYRLHPVAELLAGFLLYPADRAVEVLQFYREFSENEPDELTTFLVFLDAPASPVLPEELHGKPMVAIAVGYIGDVEAGEKVIRPLRKFGPPAAEIIDVTPYPELQQWSDNEWQAGYLNYWKSDYVSDLTDDAIETIVEHCSRFTTPAYPERDTSSVAIQPLNYFEIGHNGGAIARVGDSETAVGHRQAPYLYNITAVFSLPEEIELHRDWARNFFDAMQPFSAGGGYVNYYLEDEGHGRVRGAYGEKTYERLVELKTKYDPTNFFSLNQNIKPTT